MDETYQIRTASVLPSGKMETNAAEAFSSHLFSAHSWLRSGLTVSLQKTLIVVFLVLVLTFTRYLMKGRIFAGVVQLLRFAIWKCHYNAWSPCNSNSYICSNRHGWRTISFYGHSGNSHRATASDLIWIELCCPNWRVLRTPCHENGFSNQQSLLPDRVIGSFLSSPFISAVAFSDLVTSQLHNFFPPRFQRPPCLPYPRRISRSTDSPECQMYFNQEIFSVSSFSPFTLTISFKHSDRWPYDFDH